MGDGIRFYGASTSGNLIQGNYFGTDPTGTAPLLNGYAIKITSDAHDNTTGPNNVIALNRSGVCVDGINTTGTTSPRTAYIPSYLWGSGSRIMAITPS